MGLIPEDWEPLGYGVGPFGSDELEVREYEEDATESVRKWQVRIAARPGMVSIGMLASAFPTDLSHVSELKRAIAIRLRTIVPRSFDKEKGSLPETFVF